MSQDPRLSKKEMGTEFADTPSDELLDAVKEKLLKSPFVESASRPAAALAIVEKLSQEDRHKLAFMMVAVMIEPERRKIAQQEQEEALAAAYLQLLLPEAREYRKQTREISPQATPSAENTIVEARAGVASPDITVAAVPAVDPPGLASKTLQEAPQPSLRANIPDPPTRQSDVHERPPPSSKSLSDAPDRTRSQEVPDSEITLVSQHRSGSGHENAINFKQRDGGFDSLAAGTFDNGQSASSTQVFSVGQGMGLKAGDVASSLTMAHVSETGSPDEIAIRYRIKHTPEATSGRQSAPPTPQATVHQPAPPGYEQATATTPPPAASPPRYEKAIAAAPTTAVSPPTYEQAIAASPIRDPETPGTRPHRVVIKSNVAQVKPGLLYRLLHPAGLRVSALVRHNATESRATANPAQLNARKAPFALDADTIKGALSNGVTRRALLKQFTQERGVPFPERSRARESLGHGM